MKPRHLTAVLAAMTACTCMPASAEWRAEAERVLSTELQKAYPDVQQWSVMPLLAERQEAALSSTDPESIRVGKLGARSAVRIRTQKTKQPHEVTVWYAVSGTRPALVTSRPMQAGEAFEPSSVRIGEAQVFTAQCTPLTTPESIVGMRSLRRLGADDPVCSEGVESQPLVVRGESVAVHAKVGLVTISAKGIAQEDGGLGQRLKVRSPSSGEVYSAAVSGRGEVMVRE